MSTLTEGELQFVFQGAVSKRKFDGDDHHLSHCMKAVDFIIEFTDKYLFIEVKDPQNSLATDDRRHRWIKELKSEKFVHNLKYKYRDSFLYEWAAGRGDKPIVYVVLIALDTLEPALMLSIQDKLHKFLPRLGPGSQPWVRPIVQGCVVLNIESWNRTLQGCSVRRQVPEAARERLSL